MIVVVGSRHDRVAAALIDAWPGAALCSAEDLARPGWSCRVGSPLPPQWVVGGRTVADGAVSGVFLRRSCFYPEEFASTHPDDRAYLAAEAHAFLVFLLAATGARVAGAAEGALGDEGVRPERWIPAAEASGLAVAPVRIASRPLPPRRASPRAIEVAGDEAFGEASERLKAGAVRLAKALGMIWATVVVDGRGRVLTLTSMRAPSEPARAALGRLLAAGRAA